MTPADPEPVVRSRLADGLGLAGWIALPMLTGVVGAVASVHARSFYSGLARPAWAPPGWLFGPVWTTLYILMGLAAWMVWRKPTGPASIAAARRHGLILFVLQLVLNGLWSWIFFQWRQGAWAFVEIVVLWLAIVAVGAKFVRVCRPAAWLLMPYLVWVTFAMALTWTVWRANPAQL